MTSIVEETNRKLFPDTFAVPLLPISQINDESDHEEEGDASSKHSGADGSSANTTPVIVPSRTGKQASPNFYLLKRQAEITAELNKINQAQKEEKKNKKSGGQPRKRYPPRTGPIYQASVDYVNDKKIQKSPSPQPAMHARRTVSKAIQRNSIAYVLLHSNSVPESGNEQWWDKCLASKLNLPNAYYVGKAMHEMACRQFQTDVIFVVDKEYTHQMNMLCLRHFNVKPLSEAIGIRNWPDNARKLFSDRWCQEFQVHETQMNHDDDAADADANSN